MSGSPGAEASAALPASAANAALIERFYTAFGRRDVDAMLACYHPDVVFSDPVFGTLGGAETRAMWRMLNGRARDLRVEFGDVHAGVGRGTRALGGVVHLCRDGAAGAQPHRR